jgi:diguanylate cyclase (GGDEF)-like protein
VSGDVTPRPRRERRTRVIDRLDQDTTDGRERAEQRSVLLEIIRYRFAAAVALGVAIAVIPAFGPYRLYIGLGCVVAGCGSNLVVRRMVRAGRPLPRFLAVADLLTALAVIALAPTAYAVAVTVIVSMTGLFVFWFGGRFTLRLMPLTGLALLGLGLWFQPALWLPALLAWAITSLIATVIFARVAGAYAASRNRYDELVNGIDAAVWEARGPSGPPDYLSNHVVDMLGFTAAQLRDPAYLCSRIHPEDLPVVIESRRLIARGENIEAHFRIQDAQGRIRQVQDRVRVTLDDDGHVIRRRGILVDETARWEAEASVRRYADFIEGIPIALVILRLDDLADPDSFRVVAANPAAGALVNVASEESVGRLLSEFMPDSSEFREHMADVVRLGEPFERPFVDLPGVEEVYALRAVPLPDQSVGISLEDVTKRARMAESFRHQATHDQLTGLPNRALLHERLTRALISADRTGEPVALLLIDLDQFKEVNDALGHEYGDGLLRELARRLSARLRNCDTIARLGGDEFAILLTTGATLEGAEDVARRLNDLCEESIQVADYRLQVSASVGIALAPEHANDAETLLRRADGAMYRAKASGGGFAVYQPGHELNAVRRLELLADLREAVSSEAFVVHYQPRIDLATMQPVAIEALVRWRHPRHGLLPPAEFIELAEVSGAIRLLTQSVTRRAITDVRAAGLPHDLTVSVNLSMRNLYDPTLVEWVSNMLAAADVVPGTLCFELTESQLMDDPRQADEVLHRLRDAGVRFSVDDFGTGYSSLAYLRDLPVDEVKIDRSFVADLEQGDSRVVRSVIDLGHNLGLHVVAEGVESPEALDCLRDLGCDSAQGYHLAMPMPLDDLTSYFDSAVPSAARGG